MTVEEAIEVLMREGYMISLKGKYSLTGDFHRNYVPVSSALVVSRRELATSASQAVVTQQEKILNLKDLLRKFREDAEIPFRISNAGGTPFTANAISADAVKTFGKILAEGVDYQTLVYATKLYYKSDSFRKGLSKYLTEGDWEGTYLEFKKKLEQGTIEKYVKVELGSGFGDDI